MRDVLHQWNSKPIQEQRWIPLEVMAIGYYLCDARNFEVGYWNGKEFEYMRTKFGSTFPDTEEHWDRGSPHGTSKPIKYLGESYEH
jgi:broad specificity phosphatase PhoE